MSSSDKNCYVQVKTETDDQLKINDEIEIQQEENVVPELNEVAILSLSKVSLNQQQKISKKQDFLSRFDIYFDKIPLKGSILAVLCAFLTAISSIFTKMNVILSATDMTLTRYVVQFLIMFIIIKCRGQSITGPRKQRKLLTFRAIIGCIGFVALFFALKLLDPSDCLAITHTSIIITAIVARIFLKEKLTFAHIFAVILTAGGVFLISKPKSLFGKFESNHTTFTNQTTGSRGIKTQRIQLEVYWTTIGVIIALLCAFSSSIVHVMLKKLSVKKVDFTIPIIFVTYAGIPVSAIISIILVFTGFAHQDFKKNLNLLPMEICFTLISALIGTLSQIFLGLALNYENASKIVILRSLDVVFTFFLQYFILNIQIDLFSIIGSCSILLGSFIIFLFKYLESKISEVEDTKIKMNFCIKAIAFKF